MNYVELNVTISPLDPGAEIVMAMLAGVGFESFEETESGIRAYIPSAQFDENKLHDAGLPELEGIEVHYEVFFIFSILIDDIYDGV